MRRLSAAFGCMLGPLSPAIAGDPACLLLMDAGKIILQEGALCSTRNSPASTFKIALAAMGYDAGILTDEHTPAWPYTEENIAAWMENWKKTIESDQLAAQIRSLVFHRR